MVVERIADGVGLAGEAAVERTVDVDGELPASVSRGAIERVAVVAYLLDKSVGVPGTKYKLGIDAIIGVLPVAGDTAGAVLSLYIVVEAIRLRVSWLTVLRMLLNIAIDAVVGSVPVVGDLFDAFWNANVRNVNLLVGDLTLPVES
jgi:hypothetical protein